jgi:hypothetical protein
MVERDWSEVARVHLGEECWVCGSIYDVQWAHIAKRERDGRDKNGRRENGRVRVDPLDIVPLCGPATDSTKCHFLFDAGALDLLPILVDRAPEKITRAVDRLGMEGARRRLLPSDYSSKIEAARREVAEEVAVI